jgi:hypothetical protein
MPWPRVTPGTHWTGGWVGPRAGLDAEARRKILCLCRGSNPGRPVGSQTLYWLSYPGSDKHQVPEFNFVYVEKITISERNFITAGFFVSPILYENSCCPNVRIVTTFNCFNSNTQKEEMRHTRIRVVLVQIPACNCLDWSFTWFSTVPPQPTTYPFQFLSSCRLQPMQLTQKITFQNYWTPTSIEPLVSDTLGHSTTLLCTERAAQQP